MVMCASGVFLLSCGTFVHDIIVKQMMEAYCDLLEMKSLGESENLITKLPLGVTGVGMQLLIDILH